MWCLFYFRQSIQSTTSSLNQTTGSLNTETGSLQNSLNSQNARIAKIELTTGSVYAAYEEAVLEYSYIINVHQANNSLGSFLGHTTGTFDHMGEITSGPVSASLKYPKFDYAHEVLP